VAGLEPGRLTLRPVGEETENALAGYDDTRVLIEVTPGTMLEREWKPAFDRITGLPIEVRSAACGGGCHCAGEVRLAE
jgi:hypothetical protein